MSENIEAADPSAAEDQDFESAFAEFSRARETASTSNEDDAESADAAASADDGDHPEQEVNVTQEIKATEPAAQTPPADDVAARIQAAEASAKDWEHRFRSEIGRQTALQRKVQELESQLKAQPKGQPVQREYSPHMKALLSDFPEIAEALQAELETQLSAVRSEVQQAVAPVRQQEEQRRIAEQEAAVKDRYPDYVTQVNSREFLDWFSEQPEPVRALAGSPLAKDAIAVMDYFTATRRPPAANQEVKQIQAKRQQSLERHVSIRNSAPAPVADGPDDFERAFEYFSQKRERSQARR